MIYISPSILTADYSILAEEIERVESAGANYLHLDVMDGNFVPNISFGPAVIASLRKCTMMLFDVHLMISEPLKYAGEFLKAGADIITFHYESCKNPDELIQFLKDSEVKVSMAISPDTPADVVFPYIDKLDMVLVMTVKPGFGGQSLILPTLDKVKSIRRYADEHGLKLNIEVDGGINADNIGLATRAGANVIVAGSAILGTKKSRAVILKMRENARNNPYIIN